jgi:hypothetical protein
MSIFGSKVSLTRLPFSMLYPDSSMPEPVRFQLGSAMIRATFGNQASLQIPAVLFKRRKGAIWLRIHGDKYV